MIEERMKKRIRVVRRLRCRRHLLPPSLRVQWNVRCRCYWRTVTRRPTATMSCHWVSHKSLSHSQSVWCLVT